jgi:CheY-like chemotaxis protein
MIKLHVLFADDDADIREILALSLERDPFFVVRGCASGGEAIKIALEWRPDLALLDVRMPGMDGPAVLARLRSDRRIAAIPVVFVTARVQAQESARLRALGAAGVIEKPFDPLTLSAELRRIIPFEASLAAARETFLQRLDADACALAVGRRWLLRTGSAAVLARIKEIAHALAGVGGIYGFSGITCEAAGLCGAADEFLAGRGARDDVVAALDRLLDRIGPQERAAASSLRQSRLEHPCAAAPVV